MKSGKGLERVGSEVQYRGDFYNNYKEGTGEMQTAEYNYSGQFRRNRFHGHGAITWSDGRYYSGQWEGGLKHGFGEFIWPDLRKYIGRIH